MSPWKTLTSSGSTPELGGDDLGEGGLLALAVRRGADEDVHLAARVEAEDGAPPQPALEPDRAGHLRGSEAAHLDVGRQSDAQE